MISLFVCFVMVGFTSASILPYGAGIGHGFGGSPYYGYPMMGHGGYFNGGGYAGDGRHYGGLYSNGLTHESLGAVGGSANGGGYGVTGGNRYADQQQGLGGFHSNNFGGNFHNGNGGFLQSNGFQDASGRGSIGGFNNNGHNNGHKTTGFHKSYHNVETGRDTKYIDEDHDTGAHNLGQHFGNNFGNVYGSGYSGVDSNGQYGANKYFDQAGQHGLAGGSFNGANFDAHGGNNFYNGQDSSLRDSRLANNMNNFGQGYSGIGNSYGIGNAYMAPGVAHHIY